MKRTARSKGKTMIRQNRPDWRKKVVGHKDLIIKRGKKFFKIEKKIKGKKYEQVRQK